MASLIKTVYSYALKSAFMDYRAYYAYLILLMKMGGKALIGACSFKETLNLLFTL
jgi:hypothetical protein